MRHQQSRPPGSLHRRLAWNEPTESIDQPNQPERRRRGFTVELFTVTGVVKHREPTFKPRRRIGRGICFVLILRVYEDVVSRKRNEDRQKVERTGLVDSPHVVTVREDCSQPTCSNAVPSIQQKRYIPVRPTRHLTRHRRYDTTHSQQLRTTKTKALAIYVSRRGQWSRVRPGYFLRLLRSEQCFPVCAIGK